MTGKPGVGKSALLGVLVCAAHEVLRDRYPELWRSLPDVPAGNPRLAAVHARQRSTGFTPAVDGPLPIEQVRARLEAGRFYLRRDIDRDGTTLYRLFHESLAETLRPRPLGPGGTVLPLTPTIPPRVAVYRALLTAVPAPGGVRGWSTAAPYLLDHLAEHAVHGGMLDDLIQDIEFLVYFNPEALSQALTTARSEYGCWVAYIYQASFPSHRYLPPARRRHILALDAVRAQDLTLAHGLTGQERWTVRWAANRWTETLRRTLVGHAGIVSAVAVFDLGGRPHAVTTGFDGIARVWDLTPGVKRPWSARCRPAGVNCWTAH